MKIDEARAFIEQNVLLPALAVYALSPKTKATIQNSQRWLARFKRVGDLIVYMARFKGDDDMKSSGA